MEKTMGLVSVVIPYYNRRDTIVECLETVLAQTYSNLEVIIVDDGSAESAETVLAPFLGERVRYHRYTPNQGACHARNVGVSLARGEYIAFQDSDDQWFPQKIEKQMEAMQASGAELLFCGMDRVDPIAGKHWYYPEAGFDAEANPVEQLLLTNRVSTQTILITREAAGRIAFDESFRRFQDWDYALQAALAGLRMVYLPEALVHSEIQTDSISKRVGGAAPYEALHRKYAAEYRAYPAADAGFLAETARRYAKTEPKKAKALLKESLKRKFRVKTVMKYILFGLWAKK